MRGVASSASSLRRRSLPPSLVQRLELMQHYARAAKDQAEGRTAPIEWRPPIPSQRSQAIILAWFSLGVLTSCALGAGSIVGLRAVAAGGEPLPSWTAWAKTPQPSPAPRRDGQWDTIEVTIDRSARARAPLPLEVTGADGATIQVVLQGLPGGVRPSRGERLGESTWVLDRTDLAALYLTLDDTAPEAFDMKIGVAMSPGGIVPASIVQVRLVDMIEQKRASATGAGAPSEGRQTVLAKSGPAPASDATPTTALHASEKPAAPPMRKRAVTAADAAGLQPAAGRSWPEGASGLGAVPHEPAQPSWWQSSGQPSWWQMPPPSWSPFLVGQEQP